MTALAMHVTKNARILVVDDASTDRIVLVNFLRQQGYRLFVGENGRDGYEKAKYIVPDLVLMDIRMPECDGIVACRLLKADPKTASVPLIFLTAAGLPTDRVRGLSEGAVDYITKPYNFEEIRLRVGIHLALARKSGDTDALEHSTAEKSCSVDEIVYRAAQRLLLEDFANPPTLVKLARAVGTNPKRLNEAFKKCSGATVFEYFHEARMLEAKRQLADTNLDIATIAMDLGYGRAGNFSTAFRLRFGLSPRQYRKEPVEEGEQEA